MMIDLEQLKADRDAGTPGEWRSERDTCHFDTLSDIYAGKALIAQTGATPVQAQEADARRIARLPELEAAYIEVATKLDKAVEALQEVDDTLAKLSRSLAELDAALLAQEIAVIALERENIAPLITTKSERDE